MFRPYIEAAKKGKLTAKEILTIISNLSSEEQELFLEDVLKAKLEGNCPEAWKEGRIEGYRAAKKDIADNIVKLLTNG